MRRSSRCPGWSIVTLFAGCLCAASIVHAEALVLEFEYEGRERLALIHTPGGHPLTKDDTLRPLVLALHGGGGNAAQYRRYAGLDEIADRENFIVVYPEGASRPGVLSSRFHVWNSGRCCGYANKEHVDDVAFVLALLDRLAAELPIDPDRIYATGHSNGAMMSYRLAAEAADRIAAIAPVGGAMLLDDFSPSRPVPVLHIHSVDDPRALYEGGEGPPFPLTRHTVHHNPVESQLARWAELAGCQPEPRLLESRQSPNDRADAGHTAERLSYSPCSTEAEVELWRMTGPGHAWPGRASLDFRRGLVWRRAIGEPTAVIDAGEEAWQFFERFPAAKPAADSTP